MTRKRLKAAIYCRISLASLGDLTKTDDQERICRDLAERLGWDVAEVFTDPNRSAWRHDRKRERWDAMLEAVREGRVNAIIVYHGDRLVRQPMDLEVLIELARNKGIRLASPSGVRDLDNPDDQFILGIEANMARRESANISRRAKAGYERMRRKGLVRSGGRGGRPFGFESDYLTPVPAECELIREAARRILAGEGTKVIAADWRRRGIVSVTGVPVDHSTIRKVLSRPRVAGLMPDGVSRAAWEPVLDAATWQMVCAVLSARAAGYGYATNTRRYLLSGIARCGVCGAPLQADPGKAANGTHVVGYACREAGCKKVYRSVPLLDAFVAGWVVTRLSSGANPVPDLPARDRGEGELGSLIARRAETAEAIANLADHPGLDIGVLARSLASFDARIAELTARLAASSGAALLRAHAGISLEEFNAEPLAVRRELVRAAVRVVVMPASRRGPGFEPRDVIMSPVRLSPGDRL